jgi:lysophospholipid acyltransferase (LPLAT)-like uncharacterized protein
MKQKTFNTGKLYQSSNSKMFFLDYEINILLGKTTWDKFKVSKSFLAMACYYTGSLNQQTITYKNETANKSHL